MKKQQEFTILQQEQIDLGMKHGLSKKEIDLYAKEKYDFLQMQEIREALESGMSYLKICLRYHSWVPHQKMEKIRQEKQFSLLPYQLSLLACAVCICFFVIVFGYFVSRPYPNLVEDDYVQVYFGQEVNPYDYLKEDIDANRIEVLTQLDTRKKENQLIVYQVKKKGNPIYDFLCVEVLDESHQEEVAADSP